MDTPSPDTIALGLLRRCVTDPWESVDQVLREHGDKPLGDPNTSGTGAWHLRHIVEIFRVHAAAATSNALTFAETIPAEPPRARDALLGDVDRFIEWAEREQARNSSGAVSVGDYGGPQTLESMLGIMSRHIVWHGAAVHYWCRWKL